MARISKAALTTQIATNFADNAAGEISEADLRDQLTDQNDSYAHLDDTDALSSSKANVSHTHTVSEVTDAGALASQNTVDTAEIDNNAVTLAKIQDIATSSFLGRSTAATGDPEVLNATAAKTILGITEVSGTGGQESEYDASGDIQAITKKIPVCFIVTAGYTGRLFEKTMPFGFTVNPVLVDAPDNSFTLAMTVDGNTVTGVNGSVVNSPTEATLTPTANQVGAAGDEFVVSITANTMTAEGKIEFDLTKTAAQA